MQIFLFLAWCLPGREKNTCRLALHNFCKEPGGPGGVLAEKLGRGVRPAFQNPYPIYDQNGGKITKIDTQFMTKTAEKPYPLGPHIPI